MDACATLADFIEVAELPGMAGQSIWLSAVAVGIGRAAVDGAIEQAATRVSVASGRAWRDYPSTQNTVAAADVAIASARAGLFDLADQATAELSTHGSVKSRTHARLHAFCDHAFRTVRACVSDLFTSGSVDAVRSGHILEQSLRDIHGFGVQWERYRHLHYQAGKSLLGGEVDDPLY